MEYVSICGVYLELGVGKRCKVLWNWVVVNLVLLILLLLVLLIIILFVIFMILCLIFWSLFFVLVNWINRKKLIIEWIVVLFCFIFIVFINILLKLVVLYRMIVLWVLWVIFFKELVEGLGCINDLGCIESCFIWVLLFKIFFLLCLLFGLMVKIVNLFFFLRMCNLKILIEVFLLVFGILLIFIWIEFLE